nr:sulfotransferase [uncultured Desulfobacter sp.]
MGATKTHFIILTTQRTGSTMFYHYLNQHPSISARGELFMKKSKKDNSYKAFKNATVRNKINHLFNRNASVEQFLSAYFSADLPAQAVGFKLMYDQINSSITQWIIDNKVKIIHLIRRNTLKMILSRKTAMKRKLYHSTGTEKIENVTIHLQPEKTINEIKNIQANIKKYQQRYPQKEYIEIFYEDFVENMNKEAQAIFSFLNLDPFECSVPEYKKINTDNIQQLIENYEEITSFFGKTEFNRFLT